MRWVFDEVRADPQPVRTARAQVFGEDIVPGLPRERAPESRSRASPPAARFGRSETRGRQRRDGPVPRKRRVDITKLKAKVKISKIVKYKTRITVKFEDKEDRDAARWKNEVELHPHAG